MNEGNVALLRSYPALWSAQEVERIIALFTEDCCYEDVVLGWVHRGKGELREFAMKVFAILPDFRIRYTSHFATDSWGAAEWVIDATFTGEFEGEQIHGKKVQYRGSTIFEFQNGLISRNSDYWDYAVWMRQLNVPALRSR